MAFGSKADGMGLFLGMVGPGLGGWAGRRRFWLAGARRPAYGYVYVYGMAHDSENSTGRRRGIGAFALECRPGTRSQRLWLCFSPASELSFAAPAARATAIASSGRAPPTSAPTRAPSGATTISARSSLMAVKTASATRVGETSPAIGLALSPVSAHIPASETKVGQMTEALTPVPKRSPRRTWAKPRRPNLVAE